MEKNYKKLCPFKGWVLENFPFIEADFDAITNYELLCKIIEYLNKMGSQFNNIIDNLNYLNNWFDNLDLQEEVDNKLDEMVEAGTLQEIIAEYLNANALWCFDNVQGMKEAANLINGSYAKTLGYYSINDGGSALYKIRKITNNDIVDEASIIALNDETLIAELIIIDEMNVEVFGAKGDGTTNDANAIQIACNKVNKVIFTNNYLITNTITNTHASLISNTKAKLILNNNSDNEFTFINTLTNKNISGLEIEVPEYSTLNNTSSKNGFELLNCDNVNIENCEFKALYTKINGLLDLYSGNSNINIINCLFDINTTYSSSLHGGGIWVRDSFHTGSKNITIENCKFNSVSSDEVLACWTTSNSGNKIIENVFINNCYFNGQSMAHLITIVGVKNAIFSNNIIDSNTVNSIMHLAYTNAIPMESIDIINNVFNSTSTTSNQTFTNHLTNYYNNVNFINNKCNLITGAFQDINNIKDCDIKITDNKAQSSNSSFYNCKINVVQTSNQFIAYASRLDIKFSNCEINGSGSFIQILSGDKKIIIEDSFVNRDLFVGRGSSIESYIIKNNYFLVNPSVGSLTSNDRLLFNTFPTNPLPSQTVIGRTSNFLISSNTWLSA